MPRTPASPGPTDRVKLICPSIRVIFSVASSTPKETDATPEFDIRQHWRLAPSGQGSWAARLSPIERVLTCSYLAFRAAVPPPMQAIWKSFWRSSRIG